MIFCFDSLVLSLKVLDISSIKRFLLNNCFINTKFCMAKTVLGNRNCYLVCFLCLFLNVYFVQAQDKKNIEPDVEKVYLHTDRSTYFMGEDIWYKAYNVRASNNLLLTTAIFYM